VGAEAKLYEQAAEDQRHRGDNPVDHISDDAIESFAQTALECGAKAVMMRAGRRGLMLIVRNGWSLSETPPSDVSQFQNPVWQSPADLPGRICNTLGAGDVTLATFVAAQVSKLPIRESLSVSALSASLSLMEVTPAEFARKWSEKLWMECSKNRPAVSVSP
jgi:fructose-1-phosphate kinase PfkB-like protein